MSKKSYLRETGAIERQSSKGYLHRQVWTSPDASDDDAILNDQATSDSVATVVTSFLAQPDVPRNIIITPGGTTTDVAAGNYVIAGTNIRDEVITETIAIAANASTVQAGSKAFKTVTSITFPIQDGAAATFSVGFGDKLGLERKLSENSVVYATFNAVYETTRPTVAVSATAIESNTIDLNSALDTSKVTVAYVTTEVIGNNWDTV